VVFRLNEQHREHQGGMKVTPSKKEQPVLDAGVALPSHKNIIGEKAGGQPQEGRAPKVRKNEAATEPFSCGIKCSMSEVMSS
jgi:hypothetical protein